MPPVGAAVASAAFAAAASAAAGVTYFGLSVAASALLAGGASLVLSGVTSALAPKPKKTSASLSSFSSVRNGGLTQTVRQPVTSRKIIYGEARVGGPILFWGTSANNAYLHLVIGLAGHEVDSIGEVWLNDTPIAPDHLDGNGEVTASGHPYKGFVRIKKALGSPNQSAESALVSEGIGWSTAHRLREVAYLYVRLKWDQTVFAGGVPNISAWVRGARILDPRDGATRWSPNAALCARDYLVRPSSGTTPGIGAAQTEIDAEALVAAADVCEEIVPVAASDFTISAVAPSTDVLTLSGDRLTLMTGDRVQIVTAGSTPGGLSTGTDYYVITYQRKDTPRVMLAASLAGALSGAAIDLTSSGSGALTLRKTGEPRYIAGGVLDTAAEPGENLKDILSAMGGLAVQTGGVWSLLPAVYRTPSVDFDENDLVGPISLQTKVSRADRFNLVKGTYLSPINDGQPSDFPPVQNATYRAADGGLDIVREMDLPMTQRPVAAQRLAKIALEQMRQELVWTADFSLKGLLVRAGDTIRVSNERFGWTDKPFEVTEWAMTVESGSGAPVLVVRMGLRETAAGVYDWNSDEETTVDLAPNTSLPDPFTVAAPSGMALDSEAVETRDGDETYKIILSWTAHPDAFVTSGGRFEIQYRKTGEPDWRPSLFVDGSLTRAELFQSQLGTEYDVRMRAINALGRRSGWSTVEGFAAGGAGGVTSSEDWGEASDSVVTTEDWGEASDSVSTTEDWGNA
jgi:hypothetical protein